MSHFWGINKDPLPPASTFDLTCIITAVIMSVSYTAASYN